MINPDEARFLEALKAERDRRRIEEERERLSRSYKEFVQEAWHVLKPHEPFIGNWHLDAIDAHLEAVSAGDITRLQIWVPPGSMKTLAVSVFWHAWEWTSRPWLRYWTASYETRLCQRFSLDAQRVVTSRWYQERWGDRFRLVTEAAHHWKNNQGGDRLGTSPESTGTGEHGHRIIIDDPVPARASESVAINAGGKDMKTMIAQANDWWDTTVSSRGLDSPMRHARILVMQRLHENDLAAHMLHEEDWVVLCLPERFEKDHPYAWRGKNIHPKVRLQAELRYGDPRQEDELLWPVRRDDHASRVMAKQMTSHRAAAQLQQRPAAREGEILKRHWWRFYDPRIRGNENWSDLGRFTMIVISVDTPLKDKETNDNVAIQCWGVRGADRYLLDLRLAKMNYGLAKRTITEMATWSRRIWRGSRHQILIENAGYGPELITDLKRDFVGVVKISPGKEGNKETRAEAASDALESGNYFLPGFGPPWQPAYDEHKTPQDVAQFIHNCALFPNASYDDDVDAWSQFGNWIRDKNPGAIRVAKIRIPSLR